MAAEQKKKKIRWSAAWAEARDLIWARRWRLALGLLLVVINSAAGLVLPVSTKTFMDKVITLHQTALLGTLAWLIGGATIVQALTSFAQSQVLGVAAQRSITEMRRRIEEHVLRLPVRFFDTTQTGVLISRIMNDAEGIRNLVGTGLVQLTSSILTGIVCMIWLITINWKLTVLILAFLGGFGAAMR